MSSPPVNGPRVAVVGAGAVGGYFGGLLARAGASVVMIGRPSFVAAVQAHGLRLNTLHFQEVVRVEAATDMSAARGADLVLFCVKTTDTTATALALAPFVEARTPVISLQNGVDNVARIRAVTKMEALPAVVYIAASVPTPGEVRHVGRGDIVLGPGNEATTRLADLFIRAGVPCRISPNIEGEQWTKFMSNCAMNAISALGQATYGRIAESADARRLVEAAIDEILAVAQASGVVLPGMEDAAKARAGVFKLATQIAGALSSTAQDLNRGKPTEIDALNGFIARRGRELGVPTPVNDALGILVKLAEGKP